MADRLKEILVKPDGEHEWLCEACDTMQDPDTQPDAEGCCPACAVSKEDTP